MEQSLELENKKEKQVSRSKELKVFQEGADYFTPLGSEGQIA